jgi:hypothetical protein
VHLIELMFASALFVVFVLSDGTAHCIGMLQVVQEVILTPHMLVGQRESSLPTSCGGDMQI